MGDRGPDLGRAVRRCHAHSVLKRLAGPRLGQRGREGEVEGGGFREEIATPCRRNRERDGQISPALANSICNARAITSVTCVCAGGEMANSANASRLPSNRCLSPSRGHLISPPSG